MLAAVSASLDFWLTSGPYTEKFESRFAKTVGMRHAFMVNSGSSANLLALSALTSPKLGDRALRPGDEVITVAAGFPTTGYQDDGVTPRQMQSYQSEMTKKALTSWFGRVNYVYNGKYLLSLTYRRDGS